MTNEGTIYRTLQRQRTDDDLEHELAAPEHRILISPLGAIIGADEIRDTQISLMAEWALRELKEEAQYPSTEIRVLADKKRGIVSRELSD